MEIGHYKAQILREMWYRGYSVQRMADDSCIKLPVEMVRSYFAGLIERGSMPRTGIQ